MDGIRFPCWVEVITLRLRLYTLCLQGAQFKVIHIMLCILHILHNNVHPYMQLVACHLTPYNV